jgi:hypothetical protein
LSLSNGDAANIRELILNFHYIWALPLKVAAILYLVQVRPDKKVDPGNTEEGSITVPLTSCFTGNTFACRY